MTGSTISGLARQVHRHLVEIAVDDATGDLAIEAERHLRALAPLLPRDEREQVLGAALGAGARPRPAGAAPRRPDRHGDPRQRRYRGVGRARRPSRAGAELADGAAELLIERVIGPLGLRVDRLRPTVDARLADGSRFHAVIPPVAVDGPCLAVRRFAARGPPARRSFAAPPVAELLEELIAQRANMVVSGATSSGKTTLLNALLASVPAWRAHPHDRGRGRAPTGHSPRRPARSPTPDGRGGGRGDGARPRARRLAAPAGPSGRGRGPRGRGPRHGAGPQHRARRVADHLSRQRSRRRSCKRIEAMVLMGAPSWPPATARGARPSLDRRRDPPGLGVGTVRRVVEHVMEVAEPGGLLGPAAGHRRSGGRPARAGAGGPLMTSIAVASGTSAAATAAVVVGLLGLVVRVLGRMPARSLPGVGALR